MAGVDKRNGARVAQELLEVAKGDTAFADLYLQRARELLAPELTEAQYLGLQDLDRELEALTKRISEAVEARLWNIVADLTSRAADVKRTLSERTPIRAIAAGVFGFDPVLVDPFSPGISSFAGVAEHELPALRDATVRRLERLQQADRHWAEFYEVRRKALSDLRLMGASAAARDTVSALATLETRIQKALADGDLPQVHQLSTQLSEAEARAPDGAGEGPTLSAPPALLKPFPSAVSLQARKLGLAPQRMESLYEDLRTRFRPSWSVALGDPSGNTMRVSMTFPCDTDEALRDALLLFSNRPIVTSAGTRYIPSLVEEDVLVEDFDEESTTEAARSQLVTALGLPRRCGLTRNQIELALRGRGAAVVSELGLDPREYRLVSVPPDVYHRVGQKMGWGKQPVWTHFDGYVISRDRKLMPLAGGDVRFGGVGDVVALSPEYDSERLLARFAVVQRRRLMPALVR